MTWLACWSVFWFAVWGLAPFVIAYWRRDIVSLVADCIAEGIKRSTKP